ncbi:unnamed protein product [Microthlaspi erraticum]|uniref:Uncharacterized protein n=1 Tax=Microthlaspi erraticum TaxID=1685480 RepID=A0A6D2KPX4_9BRAS|nr:unnamed protein product [Microthlaspi erraticum]
MCPGEKADFCGRGRDVCKCDYVILIPSSHLGGFVCGLQIVDGFVPDNTCVRAWIAQVNMGVAICEAEVKILYKDSENLGFMRKRSWGFADLEEHPTLSLSLLDGKIMLQTWQINLKDDSYTVGRTPEMSFNRNSVVSNSYEGILRTYPGKRGLGIPKRCRCGGDVALRENHDGRRFFECTEDTIDGQAHLKTWWEEAITEQFDELYDEIDDINRHITCITMDCGRSDKLADEINLLKESVMKHDRKSAKELKIVVCSGNGEEVNWEAESDNRNQTLSVLFTRANMTFSCNSETSISYSGSYRSYLGHGRVGIPSKCRCGLDVALRTCDNGKRFYLCKGNTMDGEPHLRMWLDEAILEELGELKDGLAGVDTQVQNLSVDCGCLEGIVNEIEVLKGLIKKRDDRVGYEFKVAIAFGIIASVVALTALFN